MTEVIQKKDRVKETINATLEDISLTGIPSFSSLYELSEIILLKLFNFLAISLS